MSRYIYTLTDEEMEETWRLGKERANREGYRDRYGFRMLSTLEERHTCGLRTELAVAKILGGDADTRTLFKSDGKGKGDENKGDVFLGKEKISVKFRSKRDPHSMFELPEQKNVFKEDYGVLVWPKTNLPSKFAPPKRNWNEDILSDEDFKEYKEKLREDRIRHFRSFELVGMCSREFFEENSFEFLDKRKGKYQTIKGLHLQDMEPVEKYIEIFKSKGFEGTYETK